MCVILAGKNKIANILFLRNQGFNMYVHGAGFLVHRPHAISPAKASWRTEFGVNKVPLNSRKLDRMVLALAQKTYTPTLASRTSACMQQELRRLYKQQF